MAVTKSISGQELKEGMLAGIKKLNDVVSSTLGPGGRTVLIKDSTGEVKSTKDGVSAAKAFNRLENPIEDMGAQLVKNVSIKSANEAGDGTTTSTILAASMIEAGVKQIRQGTNAVDVKKGMDEAAKAIVKKLKELSVDITSEDQIKQVASVSGNNDASIGDLISTAIDRVGREGVITIEESKSGETTLEVVEGMQFSRGFKSPYFVTNKTTMQAVLEDPYVMIVDGRVSTAQELLQVLSKVNADNKSLLIIAEDFGDEALATLIVNNMRGIVKVCAVKAPEFGERKTLVLEDIACITGGQVISKDKGHKLDKLNPMQLSTMLGKARLSTVSKEETTIVDGKGDQEAIKARALEIKDQIERSQSAFEKEKLQERLGKMIGGVAIISVGGNSELEIKEKKDRVEDALMATRAALSDGVIPGGGITLYHAAQLVARTDVYGQNPDQGIGAAIVMGSCKAPFIKILENAGIDQWHEVATNVFSHGSENSTYDAKERVIVDAFEKGLLDPTKVAITAIQNAVSVAGTVLTTESAIWDENEKDEKPQDPMQSLGY
jgi:chaperonin GroEL